MGAVLWSTADGVTVRLAGETLDEDTGQVVPVVSLVMPPRAEGLAEALNRWNQVSKIVDEGGGWDESCLVRLLREAVRTARS